MRNKLLQLISICLIVFFTVALTPGGGPIGPVPPSDVAYNAVTWNGSFLSPTQNAVRDQFVAIGAGLDATFITQIPDAGLANEQAMSLLGTGAVWNATATGIQSISAALTSIGNLTETNGGLPYGTADNTYAWLAAGTATYTLRANGAAAPIWTIPEPIWRAPVAGFVSSTGDVTLSNPESSGGYEVFVTGVGDVQIADVCDTATNANVFVYVRDSAETVSIAVSAEDTIVGVGLALDAGDELDSPGNAGDFIYLQCKEANTWHAGGMRVSWTDGGPAD